MEINVSTVIWVLIGSALVYFMQAGFALCEAGLTRAKNTGNILMKNMMDFCIGTPCFWLVGFGLMFGWDRCYTPCVSRGQYWLCCFRTGAFIRPFTLSLWKLLCFIWVLSCM